MTQFSINNRPVNPQHDPQLQSALERLYTERSLQALHNRDTNFTERELSRALEYVGRNPQALTDAQRSALQNTFQQRFPSPTFRSSPFFRAAPLSLNSSPNEISGTWNRSTLFTAPALTALNSGTVQTVNGFQVINETDSYQVLRLYHGTDVLNFHLNPRGEITRIESPLVNSRSALVGLLLDATEASVLNSDVLNSLGIPADEITTARTARVERNILIQQFQSLNSRSSIESLPSSTILTDSPQILLQREAQVSQATPSAHPLYTFGAGPCLVLAAVSRDREGHVQQIGLAHIDSLTSSGSIRQYLERVRANSQNQLEVSVISGERETSLRVLDLLNHSNVRIQFFSTDFTTDRTDAVAIDRTGQVYYGDRSDWNSQTDNSRLQISIFTLQQPGDLRFQ